MKKYLVFNLANTQQFLIGSGYLSFGLIILYLVISGNSLKFIVPQYNIFLVISSIFFLAIGILGLFKEYPVHRYRMHECIIIWFLVVGFLFPPYTLGMSLQKKSKINNSLQINNYVEKENYTFNKDVDKQQNKDNILEKKIENEFENNNVVDNINNSSPQLASTPKQEQNALVGIDNKNKIVHINEDNYYYTIMELSKNYKKYDGYTIEMEGFVSRDANYLKNGEFLFGREAMVCCAADIAPFGLVALDRSGDFENGSWWKIKGKIVNTHTGNPQPKIKIQKAIPIEEISGYVYP